MLAHINVSGNVQGVGFRALTKQKAIEYHLTGWVQNKSNGNVEIEIEGNEEMLDLFIEQIKRGFHPFMRVDEVKVHTFQTQKGYLEFVIK